MDIEFDVAKDAANIAKHGVSLVFGLPILTVAETAAALTRAVRHRLGLLQAAFAARFNIPPGTLRDWEQGRKAPDRTAFAYLKVIAKEPEMVAKALGVAAEK